MLRTFFHKESIKHQLYLISMRILIFFSLLILVQAPFQFTEMDFFSSTLNHHFLTLIIIWGAIAFVCFFLWISMQFNKFSEKNQLLLTLFFAGSGIFLQYFLLIFIQPVLRYDHLRVFDAGLEILHTGKLSLTANDGYFGRYPFNISIATLNSLFFRLFQFLGIAEKHTMLALQCTYLFLIDLGIFFSWKMLRILHSLKTACLFVILCVFNPVLYVCAAGCYTTTLMVPLLMGTLLAMISFLNETSFKKKCFFGFLTGILLAFGSRIRATVLICGIALVIFLLIRQKTDASKKTSTKKIAFLTGTVLLGSLISFTGFTMYQNSYITEDYTDTQMPPLYYLMFAANPDTKGTYNESDYEMISSYDTLEEKNEVSWDILKERIHNMGFWGTLSFADHKLILTWADGTDDYSDFFTTARNYNKLHSLIAGEQKDFYALYCHIFHVAVLFLFLAAAFSMLKRKCSSPYYLVFLTLLGGMIFHILWESYYVYSFGFSMLLLMAASDGADQILEGCRSKKKAVFRSFFKKGFQGKKISGNLSMIQITGIGSFLLMLLFLLPCLNTLRSTPYFRANYAVVQDMSIGENKPLLSGDRITQTFQTDRPFNEIACKVFNPTGTENESLYRFQLFSDDRTLLFQTDFYGSQIQDKDYCCFPMGNIVPDGKQTYTICITPLDTSAEHFLTFGYYNTHHYDIYIDGNMTGADGDEKSDLTFRVYQNISANFFQL